jgi:predicted acetylornithine/succinylornithine family transaminase
VDEHVIRVYRRAAEVFVDGEGAVLRDQSGREYLDFLTGFAVSALGHNHPKLVAALREQAGQLLHVSNLLRHPYTEAVAARVTKLCGLEAVWFCNSGTEAVEAALKIARKHQHNTGTGRTGFVAMEGGFHGRTLGALSITHAGNYRAPFGPLVPGVQFVPPGDADALAHAVDEHQPAALILEPIQGESGLLAMPQDYLRACRQLCTDTGTLLIHDEIQCGSGRTGTFLCADHAGVKPDIVVLAKPIGGGLPMGLTVVSKQLAGVLEPGDHGSTFAGGPLVCRAALVFLEELCEGGLLAAVRDQGKVLSAGLATLTREFEIVLEHRGRGLMQGLRLSLDPTPLQQWLYDEGVIANVAGNNVLRLLPPYVVTAEQIDQALAVIRKGLQHVSTKVAS